MDSLSDYEYIAFTSRRGIEATFRQKSPQQCQQIIKSLSNRRPCPIALGEDAQALVAAGVAKDTILVPQEPTPQGIVNLLQERLPLKDRSSVRILCPVPKVLKGLTEPSVVPDFLKALRSLGLGRVDRIDAYVTRLVDFKSNQQSKHALKLLNQRKVSFIAISSTAEVEGLQRLLESVDDASDSNNSDSWSSCPLLQGVQIVAHGPVTARGSRQLGFPVNAVSEDPSSFAGLVTAIARLLEKKRKVYDIIPQHNFHQLQSQDSF